MLRFLVERVNMSRIFRLAQLLEDKHNIRVFAEEDSSLDRAKELVKDIFANNFSNEKQFGSEKKYTPSTTGVLALFELKKMGEPFVEKLFKDMMILKANVNVYGAEELATSINDILSSIRDTKIMDAIHSFLIEQSMPRGFSLDNREDIYNGAIKILEKVAEGLEYAKALAMQDLTEEERRGLLASWDQNVESTSFGPTPFKARERDQVNTPIYDDIFKALNLTGDNWMKIKTNPVLAPEVTRAARGYMRASDKKAYLDSDFIRDLRERIAKALAPVDIMPRPLAPVNRPSFEQPRGFYDRPEFEEEE